MISIFVIRMMFLIILIYITQIFLVIILLLLIKSIFMTQDRSYIESFATNFF